MFSLDRYILQIVDSETMFDGQFRQVHNLFRIQFRLPVTDFMVLTMTLTLYSSGESSQGFTHRANHYVNRWGIRGCPIEGLDEFMVFHATFNNISVYIEDVSFIGGGNRSTRRKPMTCRKSLTNFIS